MATPVLKTRDRIVEAARRLFNERGYGEVTTAALASHLGTAEGNLRYHFKTKRALLEAIAAIGYRAHPYDATRSEALSQRERRQALWRVFVAGFGMMQVMMYAVPVYLADGDMTPDIEQLMRWASLILTLPVILYSLSLIHI